MEEFKSGFVTIIGRTNVGKSSIINKIVGEKVSAVANKSQTTRKNIRAIVNRENSQIIFIYDLIRPRMIILSFETLLIDL